MSWNLYTPSLASASGLHMTFVAWWLLVFTVIVAALRCVPQACSVADWYKSCPCQAHVSSEHPCNDGKLGTELEGMTGVPSQHETADNDVSVIAQPKAPPSLAWHRFNATVNYNDNEMFAA